MFTYLKGREEGKMPPQNFQIVIQALFCTNHMTKTPHCVNTSTFPLYLQRFAARAPGASLALLTPSATMRFVLMRALSECRGGLGCECGECSRLQGSLRCELHPQDCLSKHPGERRAAVMAGG